MATTKAKPAKFSYKFTSTPEEDFATVAFSGTIRGYREDVTSFFNNVEYMTRDFGMELNIDAEEVVND